MKDILIRTKNLFLDALFPPCCVNCQHYLKKNELTLCQSCFDSIKINQTFFCPVCRARLPENKKICHKDSPYLLAAATNYTNDAVRKTIHALKYGYVRDALVPLGEIMKIYLNAIAFDSQNFTVVPVPLHKNRERKREFNQSALIAKIASLHLNLPLEENILHRQKNTRPQSELRNYDERIKNIEKSFVLNLTPEIIRKKNIILVDDIFTSGATISEAVRLLKQNGAGKIIALVFAKA